MGQVARAPRVGLFLLTAALLPATALGQQIYWSDETENTILRADLDGMGVEVVVGVTDAENPGAIAIDVSARRIYWAAFSSGPFVGRIRWAGLDGSEAEDVVFIGGKSRPGGVAIDALNDKLYYTDPSDCGGCGAVFRSNLDGSDEVRLASGRNFPGAVAVDPGAGFVFWSESLFSDDDAIFRADLGGSNIQSIVETDAPGLAVDPGAGKVYWTEATLQKIQRANLDGSGVEDLVTVGLDRPAGIALDLSAGRMYWADRFAGKLQRAQLDGSDVEDVLVGLPSPLFVALVLEDGEPVPAASGWGLVVGGLVFFALGGIATVVRRCRSQPSL